jgi:hypothetical protein
MTMGTWLMIGAFIILVLFTQMGHRRFTVRNALQPFVIAGVMAYMYLRNIPTSPPNLLFIGVCICIGIAFGLWMLATIHVERGPDGRAYTRARWMYLLAWMFALGSRVVFAYAAKDWIPTQFYHFMQAHHFAFSVIGPAFVCMTLAMIVVRTLGILFRLQTARLNSVELGN